MSKGACEKEIVVMIAVSVVGVELESSQPPMLANKGIFLEEIHQIDNAPIRGSACSLGNAF